MSLNLTKSYDPLKDMMATDPSIPNEPAALIAARRNPPAPPETPDFTAGDLAILDDIQDELRT